jgi:hypothetical protein
LPRRSRAPTSRIRRLRPDAIYFGGTRQPSGGRIARDGLTAAGPQGRLLAPNGCFQTTFIKAAGAGVLNERVFVTFGGLPPDHLIGKGAAFLAPIAANGDASLATISVSTVKDGRFQFVTAVNQDAAAN